ncbi:hypothetical protein CNMCM5793_006702 [Aspergillus hiratsukae]|uniref:Endo-1,4-beta-xylanase n=1 Tax=Aspergillus hiratsukae TaxID=1194566 RepID=A0A8H6P4J3_9EURO|nr:hypothetical protein CNMCM5793_006702 [Aspergillus hiratsukae]KAF7157753.1 hypothetical protein CNMCM6106_003736 [Aspergillus hiratsukae]
MFSLTSFLVIASAMAGVFCASPPELAKRESTEIGKRQIAPNQQGYNNDYFYSFWSDGVGYAQYTNKAQGEYNVQWSGVGDFTCGKGWNPGWWGNVVNFAGGFGPSGGNAYLAVYGWTEDPLVEYYIVENWTGNPPGGEYVTTIYSDGSYYNIERAMRYDSPSIAGTQTFQQFWSIRQTPRTEGTVTTANHFQAWADNGMLLGTFNYQIMLTEAYGPGASGWSDISVWTS